MFEIFYSLFVTGLSLFFPSVCWFYVLNYCASLLQGFYYDAFYGDLGLNEDHFKQIEEAAKKAVAVSFLLFLETDNCLSWSLSLSF